LESLDIIRDVEICQCGIRESIFANSPEPGGESDIHDTVLLGCIESIVSDLIDPFADHNIFHGLVHQIIIPGSEGPLFRIRSDRIVIRNDGLPTLDDIILDIAVRAVNYQSISDNEPIDR